MNRDAIIQQVIKKIQSRSDVGFKKYGVTLEDDEQPLDDVSFKNHIQTQEETTSSSQDEQEPPQHVSRFFSGE